MLNQSDAIIVFRNEIFLYSPETSWVSSYNAWSKVFPICPEREDNAIGTGNSKDDHGLFCNKFDTNCLN